MSALPTKSLQVVTATSQAAAMLEPTRLRLLSELATPASASDLARRTGEPRQRINYHLRALEAAGLVELVEQRKKGNCTERVVVATAGAYLVSPEALGELGADPARVPDRLSSAYLAAVCARSISDLGTLRARADRAGKPLATLTLESDVRFASARDMNAFAEELTSLFTSLVAKYHNGTSTYGRTFKVFAAGYPAITLNEDGTPISPPTPSPSPEAARPEPPDQGSVA